MKKLTTFFTILVLFFSCKNDKNNEINKRISENPETKYNNQFNNLQLISKLDSAIITNGDFEAYEKLRDIYFLGRKNYYTFLFYSITMANVYDNKEACYDSYILLKNFSYANKNKKLAQDFLKRSGKKE